MKRYVFAWFDGNSIETTFDQSIYDRMKKFHWRDSAEETSRLAQTTGAWFKVNRGDLLIYDRHQQEMFDDLKYLLPNE